MISFNLPELRSSQAGIPTDNQVTISFTNVNGQELHTIKRDFPAGFNKLEVTREMLQNATGIVNYTVTAGDFTATKTMISVK